MAIWDNYRYDQFQQSQVDPNNRRGQRLVNTANSGSDYRSPIGYANTENRGLISNADSMLGDRSVNAEFNNQLAPVRAGLTALPGTISGQTRGVLGTLGTESGAITDRFGAGSTNQQAGFGTLSGDLSAGYEKLADRARGIVTSISDQNKQDASRAFAERSASETGRLASMGLSGSTVGASVRTGIENERQAEMRRIADQTAREQLSVESTFGGAGLASKQQVGLAGLGEQGANLRFGSDLERTLASDLAGKGIDVARLNSDVGLKSLVEQGVISQAQFDALMDARRTRLDTRGEAADRGVNARQDVFGTSANYYGGPTLIAPSGTQY